MAFDEEDLYEFYQRTSQTNYLRSEGKSLIIIESVRDGGRGQRGHSWRQRQTPARVADADAMRALLIAMAPQPYWRRRLRPRRV